MHARLRAQRKAMAAAAAAAEEQKKAAAAAAEEEQKKKAGAAAAGEGRKKGKRIVSLYGDQSETEEEEEEDIEVSDIGDGDPKPQSSSKRKRSGGVNEAEMAPKTDDVVEEEDKEEDDTKEEAELVSNEHTHQDPGTPSGRLVSASASAEITTEVGGSGSVILEALVPTSKASSKVSVTVNHGSASAQVLAYEPADITRKKNAK